MEVQPISDFQDAAAFSFVLGFPLHGFALMVRGFVPANLRGRLSLAVRARLQRSVGLISMKIWPESHINVSSDVWTGTKLNTDESKYLGI